MSRRVRHPESGRVGPLDPVTGAIMALGSGMAYQPANHRTLETSFWTLGDGTRIAAIVYSLLDCPPLTGAAYILARRNAGKRRVRLATGRALSAYATLNLARIRYLGANLGATEVHVVRSEGGGVALTRLAESLSGAAPD